MKENVCKKKIPAYVARSKHWIYSINWIGVSIERWEEGDREKRSRRDTSIDLKYLTQYPVSDFPPGFFVSPDSGSMGCCREPPNKKTFAANNIF